MKILLLSYFFPEYCIELANALSKKNKVYLLLPASKENYKINSTQQNVISEKVIFIPIKKWRLSDFRSFRAAFRIVKFIKNINPDIVHFQATDWIRLLLVVPFIRNFKLIFTLHDPQTHMGEERLSKILGRRRVLEYVDKLIVHGDYLKASTLKNYNIPKEKIHVVPFGEFTIYRKLDNKDYPEVPNSILFFGRIWEYKGLEYLIKAEPFISKEIPEIKIVIAGQGENFKKYSDMMVNQSNFEVKNRYIEDAEVSKIFRSASIVVLPYLEATQSGIVPLAYGFGKAVVATKVGSIHEVIDDGKTGLLVEPRNSEDLANMIIFLLKNPIIRKKIALNGHKKLEKELSWQTISDLTEKVYKS